MTAGANLGRQVFRLAACADLRQEDGRAVPGGAPARNYCGSFSSKQAVAR